MSITRIDIKFDSVDTAFSKVYEMQNKFDGHITNKNKNELIRSIENLQNKLQDYKQAVKCMYIGRKVDEMGDL